MLSCSFLMSCEVGILVKKLKIRNETDLHGPSGLKLFHWKNFSFLHFGNRRVSVIFYYQILPWGRVRSAWFFFFFLILLVLTWSCYQNAAMILYSKFFKVMSPLCSVSVFPGHNNSFNSRLFWFKTSLNFHFQVSHCVRSPSSGTSQVQAQLLLPSSLQLCVNKELLSFMRPGQIGQGPCSLEVYRCVREVDR